MDKDRFCAFSGNDLKEVLRSGDIRHLVMAGVWTSGVILSTFTLAADEDHSITILSDAFADPKPLEGGEVSRDGEASHGIYFLRFGKPA